MNERPQWQYDEMHQVGVDYADPQAVAVYDARHRKFRDVEKENEAILDGLDVRAGQVVLEMGCGTGAFSMQAARRGAHVHAVDVSRAMLDFASDRAGRAGVKGIEFHHGGFLTYDHSGEPVDAAVSSVALHHLPDFWKIVGLERLAGIMRPGGRLYLMDVVFAFDPARHAQVFDHTLETFARKADPQIAEDFALHLASEFSTTTWIMEGMLERAGFAIDRADCHDDLFLQYWCTRR